MQHFLGRVSSNQEMFNGITRTFVTPRFSRIEQYAAKVRTEIHLRLLKYGPLGRPRRRWMDNIRMDLQEVGCGYVDWFGLAQDRDRWRTVVSAVMNLRVPWNAGNFLTDCKPVSCSGRTLQHGVSKVRSLLISINACVHFLYEILSKSD